MGRLTIAAVRRTIALTFAMLAVCAPASAADFYQGKTIRLIIGSGAGSAYDLYSRLLASHLGNHIPGKPAIVPQAMVGAAGLVAANYMAGAAPRDGTVIASAVSNLPTAPLLRPNIAKFDARKFNWIGNMAKGYFRRLRVEHGSGQKLRRPQEARNHHGGDQPGDVVRHGAGFQRLRRNEDQARHRL